MQNNEYDNVDNASFFSILKDKKKWTTADKKEFKKRTQLKIPFYIGTYSNCPKLDRMATNAFIKIKTKISSNHFLKELDFCPVKVRNITKKYYPKTLLKIENSNIINQITNQLINHHKEKLNMFFLRDTTNY